MTRDALTAAIRAGMNVLLVWALSAPAVGHAAAPPTAEEPPLAIQAWISTAGPYGESWDLSLTPEGEIAVQVFYSAAPSGNVMARFRLSEKPLAAIRQALATETFFSLPSEISPPLTMLHQPDLRLDVWLGDKRHKVRLYDPKSLPKDDPRAKRFLAVWASLFQPLPLKPKW